ncbi:hypothetical protein IWQ57_000306 [Coemansia nantahalensis]|uniref:Uncharacterized protein n=1 Tax=Coemansia nantahalensis TaxID=2789366 RepID=A0ACC1K7X4_9FUNG|nr:hypothetical protein IWQ57_000306 [Coemansia nantahalensis]
MTIPAPATGSWAHEPATALAEAKAAARTPITRAFTWAELQCIIASEQFDQLGRTAADREIYAEDMRLVCQQYESVANYIRNVKLAGFVDDPTTEYLLLPNDYPYALEADTTHLILWSKYWLAPGTALDPTLCDMIVAQLDGLFGAGTYEWLWFVNPAHLQSIPEVSHGHLLVRKPQ